MNLQTKLLRYAGVLTAAVAAGAVAHIGPAAASTPPGRSVAVIGHQLWIVGTSGDDDITVALSADGATASVDFGEGGPWAVERSTFATVGVLLRNGADRFRVSSVVGQVADPRFTVYGGNGDDDLGGGRENDTLYGERGDDVLDGGVGADTEFLGAGADTARWVPGEGSDLVDGGLGGDTLDFVGAAVAESMTLEATGDHAVLTRVQGTIRMDLTEVELVALSPLAGADRLTIAGTDAAETVEVDAVAGTVEVTGLLPRTVIKGPERADQLQINTLGGRDRVQIGGGVADLITPSVDLGSGQ